MIRRPVCGAESLPVAPWPGAKPSYDACGHCGTQFGIDDAIGFTDRSALPAQHERLRERWHQQGDTADEGLGLPSHLAPDGPFAAEVPQADYTRVEWYALRQHELRRQPLLTPEHCKVIAEWIHQQSNDDLEIEQARAPEVRSYLHQTAAAALIARDESPLASLIKTAMVLGAYHDDPRDRPWRHLGIAMQLASLVSNNPHDTLYNTAREVGATAATVVADRIDQLHQLRPSEVTWHQPTGLPLIEEPWDPRANAKLLIWVIDPWDTTQPPLPWDVPHNGYLPYLQSEPASRATEHDEFIASVNRYLATGDPAHAKALKPIDGSQERQNLYDFARSFWDNSIAAPSNITGPIYRVVNRGGVPQIAKQASLSKS